MGKRVKLRLAATGTFLSFSVAAELFKYHADPRFAYGAAALEAMLAAVCGLSFVNPLTRFSRGAAALLFAVAALFFASNLLLIVPSSDGGFVTVVHGGGGGSYLNSFEYTQSYVAAGSEYIELDFVFTEDGALVCSHRFEYGGYSMSDRPTLEEFEQIVLAGGVTGMTADELVFLMSEDEDFRVVFDTKETDMFSVLSVLQTACESAGVDFYGRFIVQFYSYEDYLELREYPFEEIWFTDYKAGYTSRTIEKYFGADERVTTIVLSERNWVRKACFGRLHGKKIAVHTVDSRSLAAFYARRGVDYIFSDYGF